MIWGRRKLPVKYLLDYTLRKGIFVDYRLLFDEQNFNEHQSNHPERNEYNDACKLDYINKQIPETFETSNCFCKSININNKRRFCIYYKYNRSYPGYLKVVFSKDDKNKIITIITYFRKDNISEPLCKKLI